MAFFRKRRDPEMDNLIADETAELETLKAHKRGLMQQLFPNPNK